MGVLLFISVLLIAACGLIYELVAGTLASYLIGDSVFVAIMFGGFALLERLFASLREEQNPLPALSQ